jgi:endonuclease/exonuclease/phosphatase family metal-dependent hydrolase
VADPKNSNSPAVDLASIAALIDGDLLALQEIDENQMRSGELSQVKELAKLIGAKDWGYGRCVIGTPGVRWRKLRKAETKLITNNSPVTNFFESSYGIGLISKLPVKQWHQIELGRSIIGLPLAVGSEKGMRLLYVKDEPRIAIAAELENGYTVAVTHLSFVPFVNLYQLFRVKRWLGKLPGKHFLVGDLNLPFNLPVKFSKWRSLSPFKTYPSWKPSIAFDYVLTDLKSDETKTAAIAPTRSEFSDHLPVIIEIN